ncbi:MAG TPA: universal stress protein [Terracidiphilus sp.]|jgi:nucleotide-binding universal stress UspA family protein
MSFQNGLKTIVVATDLESRSEPALEYAHKLAANYGARIVLAHSIDPVDYARSDGIPGRILRTLPEEARAALDSLACRLLQEAIPTHSEVRQGAVAQMLLDVARQYEAGLIVIGTRGMDGVGPLLVGSIAEQLVRLAPCPVLAVSADWNAGPYRPMPGGPVLLAIERNEAAQAAAATAYSLAEIFGRPLIVLHARTAAETSAFLNPGSAKLEEFGIHPGGKVLVRYIVKDGNPADAVAAAIALYHPSILVAGVKRSSESGVTHGTAFTLLAESRVPVLCVPPVAQAVAAR